MSEPSLRFTGRTFEKDAYSNPVILYAVQRPIESRVLHSKEMTDATRESRRVINAREAQAITLKVM